MAQTVWKSSPRARNEGGDGGLVQLPSGDGGVERKTEGAPRSGQDRGRGAAQFIPVRLDRHARRPGSGADESIPVHRLQDSFPHGRRKPPRGLGKVAAIDG